MSKIPNSLEARDLDAVFHPATNFKALKANGPLVIDRAEGIYIYDTSGKQYLEGMAGLWCTSLGYGVKELSEVAKEQMDKMAFSPLFAAKSHEPAIVLAEKLKALSPLNTGKVFFGNSGSDANDTQIKMIRYYNNAIGRPNKKKFIARERAYHGITVASGSLTGLAGNHANFDLPMEGIFHTDHPHYYRGGLAGESEDDFCDRIVGNLENLILEEGPDTVAAFIAEPVLGAGGVVVPHKNYYPKIKAVCDKYDIITIADEVITGFGRTGNMFGCETTNFQADTMTMAKALSSAYLPISAVSVPDWLYDACEEDSAKNGSYGHGYTYSGHPVSCAVAVKTLELMEEWNIIAHVKDVEKTFLKRLHGFKDHPLVGETRGVGLIGAIELVKDKATKEQFPPATVGLYLDKMAQQEGLIIRPLRDTIAFCPPLVITHDEINDMFDRFERALNATTDMVTREGLL